MTEDIQTRISEIVLKSPIVLFMKGTRCSPQCGFSAKIVDLLDELVPDYETVNALSDEALRDGIKRFSDWPTLPQLYVGGKFVGGSDIVSEMAEAGELAALLGVDAPLPNPEPEVTITPKAVAAFIEYAEGPVPDVRLTIDRDFDASLEIEAPKPKDIVVMTNGVRLSMDRKTARRADGLSIDFVNTKTATGFRIENPNAPPKVRSLSVADYAQWRAKLKPHTLYDVRTLAEYQTAMIEGAVLVDEEVREQMDELDRSTTLVFQCHHGVRSRAAAEHAIRMGFREVWNLEGGIEAWSNEIDPRVPKY